MRIYRPAYSKPLPAGSKIKQDKAGKYIVQTDRQGQPKKARVLDTPQGLRISIESSFYTIVFRDHAGTERRLQGYRDKAATDILAENIGKVVYHRQQGEVLPARLQEWADSLPENIHSQLASFGMVKSRRVVVSQALEELLTLFEQHLAVKRQRDAKYIMETCTKLRRTFKGCGFTTFTDIDDVVLDKYLLGLRKDKNLSTRTLNGYLGAAQQFARFAVRVLKVAKSSPLECMEGFGSEAADRRRQRRALTAQEVQKLLTTTHASEDERYGMDGAERALLYRFALTTGLRANEIRTLRVEHVDLDDPEGPVLYVEAAYSKHRERDVLPVHRELVEPLRRFIQQRGKLPTAKLFGGRYQSLTDKTCDMVKDDLVDAGIEFETVAGIVDFHSLRHTFVSSLKGIAARQAQGLARHKSSDMTDRYSHRSLAEQRAALESVNLFGMAG